MNDVDREISRLEQRIEFLERCVAILGRHTKIIDAPWDSYYFDEEDAVEGTIDYFRYLNEWEPKLLKNRD